MRHNQADNRIRQERQQTRRAIQSSCKSCKSIATTAWRKANREKYNATSAMWSAANSEKQKTIYATYRQNNLDECRARCSAHKKSHPEIARTNQQNRRAREIASGGSLSKNIIKKLYTLQRGKCACGCKQPLGDDFHLDHRMPLALGGSNTDDNMQLLTATCNMQKGKKHPVDFMQQRGFLL